MSHMLTQTRLIHLIGPDLATSEVLKRVMILSHHRDAAERILSLLIFQPESLARPTSSLI